MRTELNVHWLATRNTPFNLGETMMEDILAFVVQWGDTIVEILNRIIAAIEAFVKEAPTPK